MMSEIKKLSLLVLINMAAATSAYAARIVDTANQKAVNNVNGIRLKIMMLSKSLLRKFQIIQQVFSFYDGQIKTL